MHLGGEGPSLTDRGLRDLPGLLNPKDILVFNDTRVIPARLAGIRVGERGEARVEVTLHRRVSGDTWRAFAKPAKKLRPADEIDFATGLSATVTTKGEGGEVELRFDCEGPALDAAIAEAGVMPLPPYIASRRAPDDLDIADYQTVYARHDGAVAAPTAGLHFTTEILAALSDRNIEQARLTLHVGAGTFLPVKAADTADHKMHAERGILDEATATAINRVREQGGRVVAVGTTSLRLLESAADEAGRVSPFDGETDIFITPGYRFNVVDMLLTNFHLPRSTLFMLVCAFAGEAAMKSAYAHAIADDYRFYSYGDACLLEREGR